MGRDDDSNHRTDVGLFPFRVEWVFSASKRDTQAVTKPMGDAKVELVGR